LQHPESAQRRPEVLQTSQNHQASLQTSRSPPPTGEHQSQQKGHLQQSVVSGPLTLK
jgi:hypothetical protein